MADTTSQTQQPTLERTLGLGSVIIIGAAYMTPGVVLGTFGVVSQTSNGTVPTAYLVTIFAMILTAYSYGRMASVHSTAGSAYTYVGKEMGPQLGFVAGWLILLDYFFLPMVAWLIGGVFMLGQFPGVPISVWIIGFVVISTTLNVIGIKVSALANYLLVGFQVLVLAIFVVLSIAYFMGADTEATLWTPFFNDDTTLAAIVAGAAVAAYSFIGFDAITTLTEETRNPRRTMPRAIMLLVLSMGSLFIIVSYAAQLAHPGSAFANVDSGALEIATDIGGNLFIALFIGSTLIASLAAGLAIQATSARLLYAMGRDGVLPNRIFGYLQPRLHTPVFGIVLIGIVGLAAIFLNVTTSTSFILFGAFTAFTLVNLSAIIHFLRHRPQSGVRAILGWIAIPFAGALVDLYLLWSLGGSAKIIGLVWLAVGIVLLAWLTRGFRKAPPQMSIDEEASP